MSIRNYISISFSEAITNGPGREKLNALLNLQNYIESRPEIWTGFDDDDDYSIAEATMPFLSGMVNLNSSQQYEIISGELTAEECREIEALGFQTGLVSLMVRAI